MLRRALLAGALVAAALLPAAPATAETLPPNFQSTDVLSPLAFPVAVRFAPNGDPRVFVAEKHGDISVFSNIDDTTPTLVTSITTEVHNYWDRGLLGLAIDPGFPASPYLYAIYARDAFPIGGTPPRWGSPTSDDDPCPTPPGPTEDGCVITGRIVRIQINPANNTVVGSPQTLVDNWCQQYPSHSVGTLAFGPDGMLYASAGEGASFFFMDYGQDGDPVNPCGDEPGGAPGDPLTPPTAEGGAVRAQALRGSANPIPLGGTVIRIDPATGAAAAGNPLIASPDPNKRRVVAYGLRNPFRFTVRPGTGELWIGDVGWSEWEELNRVDTPLTGPPTNFGWPCYEGAGIHPSYDTADLSLCESLYAEGTAEPPYYSYLHAQQIVPGEDCQTGSSSISALDFYETGPFPASYDGALFFGDYSRSCIWAMPEGTNGQPDASEVLTFASGADVKPTDVQVGPDGNLYYARFDNPGRIVRVQYFPENQPPDAVATADPENGAAPLHVEFDGTGSSDPDVGDSIDYDWDLDGDGQFDDSTSAEPTRDYAVVGATIVRLRVTDEDGLTDVSDPITISSGNTPPTATINSPAGSLRPEAGDPVVFSGSAADAQETLGATAMEWTLTIRHCPGGGTCHEHEVQQWPDVATESFVAPGHEYPSFYDLRLTVTDSGGLSDSDTVSLDPLAVTLTVQSSPPGRGVSLNAEAGAAPLALPVIAKSSNSVSAVASEAGGPDTFHFGSWSDGGGPSHNVTAGSDDTTVTATYLQAPRNTVAPEISGTAREGETLGSTTGTWVGSPTLSYSRRWRRCDGAGDGCADIPGATGETYVPGAADVGARLRLAVTAANPTPETATETTGATSAVAAAPVPPPPPPPSPFTPPAPDPKLTPKDRRPPTLRTTVPSPQRPLRSGTLRAWAKCPFESCRASLRTSIPGATARARPVTLATKVRSIAKGRRSAFVLRLSPAARRALAARLRARRRSRLALTVRAADRVGNATVRVLIIEIRR